MQIHILFVNTTQLSLPGNALVLASLRFKPFVVHTRLIQGTLSGLLGLRDFETTRTVLFQAVLNQISKVAHVTVRRGAVRQEFQTLLSKLEMHRMSTTGSLVTLIKGNKRFRLGKLTEINSRRTRRASGTSRGSFDP